MADYPKMYTTLCGAVSRVLESMPNLPENEITRFQLEQGLVQAEDIYINTADSHQDH